MTRPERRPRRFMRAASGMAMIADPVVNAALPSPANRSEPSRSLPSSDTTATTPATAA